MRRRNYDLERKDRHALMTYSSFIHSFISMRMNSIQSIYIFICSFLLCICRCLCVCSILGLKPCKDDEEKKRNTVEKKKNRDTREGKQEYKMKVYHNHFTIPGCLIQSNPSIHASMYTFVFVTILIFLILYFHCHSTLIHFIFTLWTFCLVYFGFSKQQRNNNSICMDLFAYRLTIIYGWKINFFIAIFCFSFVWIRKSGTAMDGWMYKKLGIK